MSIDRTSKPAMLAVSLVPLAALLVMAVSDVVLAGWAFDLAALKSVLPGWVSMKANTAACFILIGIALLLTAHPPVTLAQERSILFSRLARLCGLLAGLTGLLTLGEYIFGWNPGIDHWLVSEAAGTVGTSHPGRMAPETALNFVLLSVALWVIDLSRQTRTITRARRAIIASVSLGLLVATSAVAALLTYLTPGLGAYGWFGLTIMAVHTAILFMMLGMAVIAISWRPEVLSWSLSRRTTAAITCGMALLVFIGLSTSRSQFWMEEANREIAHTEKVQGDIESVLSDMIDAVAHTRGYIITGDELFLEHYLSAKADSDTKLDALRRVELVAAEPDCQQHFAQIEAKVKALTQWLEQVIDARRTGMTDAVRSSMVHHGENLLNNLRSTFDQIKSEHRQLVHQLKQEEESVSRFAYLTIFFGTLTSLLIFLAVIFRLNFAVSEREQKEWALRESEERYRLMQQNSMDAIMLTAPDGTIYSANPAACAMLQRTEDEIYLLGRNGVVDLNDPRLPVLLGDRESTGSAKGELTMVRKDGSKFEVELSSSIFLDSSGKKKTSMIIRDITERKQAEAAMNALTEVAVTSVGTEFFHRTVRSLCTWLGVDFAIISEVVEGHHMRALAMQLDGQTVEQYEYALPGTPCESATQKGYCEYHEGVARLFPADKDLVDMRAEAYIGMPILDNGGKVIGVLCALSRHRFVPPPMVEEVFKIIATRAGIEIERKNAEEKIKEQVDYLERFRKISVKRELRIKELVDATEKLKAELEGSKHG